MPEPSHTPTSFDPVAILRERVVAAIRAAFPEHFAAGGAGAGNDPDPLLGPAREPKFGDFQSNAAMPLAKALGKPPREVAAAIVAHLDLSGVAEPLTKDSIAGPGFINIRLSGDALASALDALDAGGADSGGGADGARLGVAPPGAARETVVVDLCGVNLAKQMHVGHLRSTVIGDALARVHERLGHTVIRQSHFGDWGLPIAMVVARIKRLADSGAINLASLTLDDLDKHYKAAQRACERDAKGLEACGKYGLGPKALAESEAQVSGAEEEFLHARQTLIALQRHEPAVFAVWQRIADITISECMGICARLRANVDASMVAGESTYSEELAGIIADLETRKVAEPSQGALIVRLDAYGIAEPLLVRKTDGGFLYATTDLAGVRRRVQKLGADRVIYAVDARQSLHFKQVFAASKKAGYAKRLSDSGGGPFVGTDATLEHAAFGTVLGDDGRPFKTRSGENVRLQDLLDEAVARAERAVAERDPELPEPERRTIAEGIGIAAIKYVDLSTDRMKDYVFNFDRMLAFEGDTGPYLLYALVRIKSIFRKATERGVDVSRFALGATPSNSPEPRAQVADPLRRTRDEHGSRSQSSRLTSPVFSITEAAEKTLALALLRYPASVRAVAEHAEPHRLCGYLHDLAGAFSSFFTACPVLPAEEPTRSARLRLCALTARVLEDGLHTLGIPTVDRM